MIRLNVSPFQGSVNDISMHYYNPDIPSGFRESIAKGFDNFSLLMS